MFESQELLPPIRMAKLEIGMEQIQLTPTNLTYNYMKAQSEE